MGNKQITIIIATFNADNFLENCIESIVKQKDENIELIIIDGGSTDKTVSIINRYESRIDYWISEPDKGIYDAWNKGINACHGQWIMFIGSDDVIKENALSQYLNFISEFKNVNKIDFISSRVEMVDKSGNILRIKGWPWSWPKFLLEMTVAHPGALHSRSLFSKYGLYDTNYKITGDYELLLRPKENLKTHYLEITTVKMMVGGASDSIKAIFEHNNAAIKTGGLHPVIGWLNLALIIIKHFSRKTLLKIGVNIYLKEV